MTGSRCEMFPALPWQKMTVPPAPSAGTCHAAIFTPSAVVSVTSSYASRASRGVPASFLSG